MLPRIPISGRMVADPELRFSEGSGKAFCTFRVVASDRKQVDGKWVDDKTLWQQCVAFGDLAEHIAESLVKGDLVVVLGRLETKEWTDREGAKQSRQQLICDDVGASLVFRSFPHRAAESIDARPGAAPTDDPWATPAPEGGAAYTEPPPF